MDDYRRSPETLATLKRAQRISAEVRANRAEDPERIKVRFMAKINTDGSVPAHRSELGNCWLWTASRLPSGYGLFSIGRRRVLAHRASFELFVGPIPDGYQVDHLCVNPPCANPKHLDAVTPVENNRRSTSLSAQHGRKTHCKRGHPFDEANTKLLPNGRLCRACHRDYERERRKRLREQAEAGERGTS